MFKEMLSPFGRIERAALLRLCSIYYVAQILWAFLPIVLLYASMEADFEPPTKLIGSLYYVFLYLFLCAFSRRLSALSYSRFWLIPIAVILCCAIIMTAFLSIEIVPINIAHFMDKNYPMILTYTALSSAVAFSGSLLVSIAIAYLPKRNFPPKLSSA